MNGWIEGWIDVWMHGGYPVVVPCVSANTRLCRVWLQVTEVERKTAYDNFYGKLTTDMLRAKVLC